MYISGGAHILSFFGTGGYLAEVDTEDEDKFIFNLFRSTGKSGYGPWIGGHDRHTEGQWFWYTSGKAMSSVVLLVMLNVIKFVMHQENRYIPADITFALLVTPSFLSEVVTERIFSVRGTKFLCVCFICRSI